MKLRHAAALALVGWYLLTPPITDSGRILIAGLRFDNEVPLTLWRHTGSFDSAAECQAAKVTPEMFHATKNMTQEQSDWLKKNGVQLLQYSQCIATDDPRLKSK